MSSSDAFLQRASETLNAARTLYDAGFFRETVSRAYSYYAMFYAVEAMLLHGGYEAKTHRGAHILFNEHFLKPGLLPEETGSALRRAFENRQVADYDPDLDVTEEAERKTLEAAADFVKTITRMIRP